MKTLIFIPIILLVVYYYDVFNEAFGDKYYGNMIHTKIEFIIYLIPFSMWLRRFIIAFKNLE